MLIKPHGGTLVSLLLSGSELSDALERSRALPAIQMNSRETADLYMLANGSFSPLRGFMGKADYLSCLREMKLSNGVLWPLPVCLAISAEQAATLKPGMSCALLSGEEIVGEISIAELYEYDVQAECQAAFGTIDPQHPGVAKTLAQKPVYVGGEVRAFSDDKVATQYPEYASPAEVRACIEAKGWKRIAAFQTRNPIHRAHEYLTKVALEVCDGILIHPIVGALKEGDIPADVRLDCYRALLDKYYPQDRALLKVYPMEMRYAGPKEAILHCIIRQNFGCTDMIIGRDHAGVGNYYGPFEAQDIFDRLPAGSLEIGLLKFDWTFWCKDCGGVASAKSCPHGGASHLKVSGTELRRLLSEGQRPPEEITRPEIADILIAYYRNN